MNAPNENPDSRVTVEETATEYVYRFDPPINEAKLERLSWKGLDLYGGFAQKQAHLYLRGGSGYEIVFAFPKTADRDNILAIFDRLRQGNVVDIELTTEKYPSKKQAKPPMVFVPKKITF